jgi:putative nucleotidyltransferase with HDIG domain
MNNKERATKLCAILQSQGYQSFFVGGAVRDFYLNKEPKDYDIATDATPEVIQEIFENLGYQTLKIGAAFGIISVIVDGEPFEIATFRTDQGTDGRHPENVNFISDIEIDLSRRDLTINAMAYDPIADVLVDPFGGLADIQCKIIRFVGNPVDRIREDYLRILRVFRFASVLSFDIHNDTLQAIYTEAKISDIFLGVSEERIAVEFQKIICGDGAVEVLDLLIDNKILFRIIPELFDQLQPHNSPRWHNETWEELGTAILAHTMNVFSKAVERTKDNPFISTLIIRLGALLHDIGKPSCRENRGDHDRYLHHDIVGAELAKKRLETLRFKNDYIKPIIEIVRYHMNCHDLVAMKDVAKMRRFVGKEYFDYILEVAKCDTLGTINEQSPEPDYTDLLNKVNTIKTNYPDLLPTQILNGKDLIEAGLKPCETFKDCIEKAYDQQLRGVQDKNKLLSFAIGIFKQYHPINKMSAYPDTYYSKII